MMKRIILTAAAASLLAVGAAGPAAADHDHQLNNPSGCHTIPVGHQAHGDDDPGNKFHGSAHVGAATDDEGVLGKGNSRASVTGGGCE